MPPLVSEKRREPSWMDPIQLYLNFQNPGSRGIGQRTAVIPCPVDIPASLGINSLLACLRRARKAGRGSVKHSETRQAWSSPHLERHCREHPAPSNNRWLLQSKLCTQKTVQVSSHLPAGLATKPCHFTKQKIKAGYVRCTSAIKKNNPCQTRGTTRCPGGTSKVWSRPWH